MTDLEHDVRTMLARRAADPAPHRPPWRELAGRPTVVELAPVAARSHRLPALAAAAVLVVAGTVAAVAAVAVDRDATVATVTPAAPPAAVPPPFDPAVDPPVWPVGGDGTVAGWFGGPPGGPVPATPAGTVEAYLADRVDVPEPLAISDATVDEAAGTASYRWALLEDPDGPGNADPVAMTSGRVWLRRIDAAPGPVWTVVGAVDDEVAVEPSLVQRAGGTVDLTLRLVATDPDVPPDSLAVTVLVDGRPVPLGGMTLPQGAEPDPSLGEVFEAGDEVHVTGLDPAAYVVRVRQVGGAFLSVAEMALAPPSSPWMAGAVPDGAPLAGTTADDPVDAAAAALRSAGVTSPSLTGDGTDLRVGWRTADGGGAVVLRPAGDRFEAVAVVADDVRVTRARGGGLLVAGALPGTAVASVGAAGPEVAVPGAGIPVPLAVPAAAPGDTVVVRVTWADGRTAVAAFALP
ncbi:MAG TPA: hypothetical protein VGB14_07220 [Acidimicrobiales bacterium]|jgi:hypothetical protein